MSFQSFIAAYSTVKAGSWGMLELLSILQVTLITLALAVINRLQSLPYNPQSLLHAGLALQSNVWTRCMTSLEVCCSWDWTASIDGDTFIGAKHFMARELTSEMLTFLFQVHKDRIIVLESSHCLLQQSSVSLKTFHRFFHLRHS